MRMQCQSMSTISWIPPSVLHVGASMISDLISKRTRIAFRETMSRHLSLRLIKTAFEGAEIECDMEFQPSETGERRCFVEQFYHHLNFQSATDTGRLLRAYEEIINHLCKEIVAPNLRQAEIDSLVGHLKRDGYRYLEGHFVPVAGGNNLQLDQIRVFAAGADLHYLSKQIERIQHSVSDDPALAIGSAKELVETCCRTILSDLGEEAPANAELKELTKATFKKLNLLPDDVPEHAKGAGTIKRLLANLNTISVSLAELRNLY
jgi:hypothetical protein